MEKNQIKICSDPYRKHTRYFWYEEGGRWSSIEEMNDSPLNSERFISQPVSHMAYDMFKIVREWGDSTGGIKIIFEGTDDDFSDLTAVRDIYYSNYDIELVRGARKMKLAKEVMPRIETSYANLYEYFEEYPDKETEAAISRYSDAVKPEIAICVMGLYSSGKSAFINSIIGQEILPSASDPATAKIYKICKSEKCEIMFAFEGADYKIEFDDLNWKINKNPDNEIITLIKKAINEKETQAAAQLMYYTLDALNEFAKKEGKERHKRLLNCAEEVLSASELKVAKRDEDKIDKLLKEYRIKDLIKTGKLPANKLGDVIEVHINFVHSFLPSDQFKFVIYDTPGSNSVMFREHADILKESLEQQTNGLPIFVTNPDSMDETDNNDIMEIINDLGEALDASNMLLIVNKSDEKSIQTLRKKIENKDDLAVIKWKASRVYFISSVIGLGGKKENPEEDTEWMNEDNWGIFLDRKEQFSNPNDRRYKRLFEYNILPEDASERISKRAKEIEDRDLLLWNSGVPCVEEEIGTFAQKYALYNKCAQAIQYLKDAANKVKESISDAERKAEGLRNSIERRLDEKKEALVKDLKGECDKKKEQFVNCFADEVISSSVLPCLDMSRIEKVVSKTYKSSQGKNDYAKLEPFNKGIELNLKTDIERYAQDTSNKTEEYWQKCAKELGSSLLKMVIESPHLSDGEKEILKKVVLKVVKVPNEHKDLNIIDTSAVRFKGKKFLLFFDRTQIDQKKAQEEYGNALREDIEKNNKKVILDNEHSFGEWVFQLLNELEMTISSFNPKLINLSRDLEEQKRVIESKKRQDNFITKTIGRIDELLKFEEV